MSAADFLVQQGEFDQTERLQIYNCPVPKIKIFTLLCINLILGWTTELKGWSFALMTKLDFVGTKLIAQFTGECSRVGGGDDSPSFARTGS